MEFRNKKTVAGQTKDGIEQRVIQEVQEFGILKANELQEYNKIDPNFSKEYLQNYNNINRVILSEIVRTGRNQTIGIIGALILIASFILQLDIYSIWGNTPMLLHYLVDR